MVFNATNILLLITTQLTCLYLQKTCLWWGEVGGRIGVNSELLGEGHVIAALLKAVLAVVQLVVP